MKFAANKKPISSSMHCRGFVSDFLSLEPAWSQQLCQSTVVMKLYIENVQDHMGL